MRERRREAGDGTADTSRWEMEGEMAEDRREGGDGAAETSRWGMEGNGRG